ncbi:hypothetical protein B6U98_04555 [Thermoplasmatales archaeon ex4572_165]|nr:MAG: hypothetical protein B6U98_04555 [Thermoplasmatales archaeon ex4572_165]
MPKKEKKSEKIDLVRKILDNPNELTPSTNDKYIDTLKFRLKYQSRYHQPKHLHHKLNENGLKPTVQIHHEKIEEKPSFEPEQLNEKKEDSPNLSQPLENGLYDEGEDLFEIEQVSEYEIPDFIEVKPKDQLTSLHADKNTSHPIGKNGNNDILPKWELVEEDSNHIPKTKEYETFDDYKKEDRNDDVTLIKPDEQENKEIPIWEPALKNIGKEKKLVKKKNIFKQTTKEKTDKKPELLVTELKKSIKKLHKIDTKLVYNFKGYILYQKEIDLGNNKKRVIHFFSKDKPDESIPSALPDNYEVKINKKTGVPYIRKKRN